MTNVPKWRRYLRFIRPNVAGDVSDELDFHLEMRVADYVRLGLPPEQARAEALARFGEIAPVRDALVDHDQSKATQDRRREVLSDLVQDIRFGWRSLRRAPDFAAAIVITLGIAVGANAAVFSLVDPLLLRSPRGVGDPGSIRRLYTNFPNSPAAINGKAVNNRFSYPEYLAIRASLGGIARVAAYNERDSVAVTWKGDSVIANIAYVTSDYLPLLGVQPERGRLFTDVEDDVVAPTGVAVVSQRFARRMFSAAASPVGQSFSVEGTAFVVVGVTASGFEGMDWSSTDLWVPLSTVPRFGSRNGTPWYRSHDRYLPVVARVEGRTDDQTVEARATVAYVRADESTSQSQRGRSVVLGPIVEARGPGPRSQEVSIATRLALVAIIVLLIATANVSNLLLARAVRRRREIAVRLALGISRRRLAAQLLTETTMLALIAGAAATLAAAWAGAVLRLALLPRFRWVEPPVGLRVLTFTAAAAIAAAFLATIAPAIVASRPDLADALKSGSRDSTLKGSRVRNGLVVVQTAFSVTLLIGAALFGMSLRNVRNVDLGFDNQHLIVGSLWFPDQKHHPEVDILLPTAAERIAQIPGVAGATYASGAPLASWFTGVDLFTPDRAIKLTSDKQMTQYVGVTADYFAVTGTRVLAGRGFLPSDQRQSLPVMVVSSELARVMWPGQNPIGKCVVPDRKSNPCYTVVGVVADAHRFRIVEAPNLSFYLPLSQSPFPPSAIVVRARSEDTDAIASVIGSEMRRTFPTARISARSASAILEPQIGPWRLGAQLFSALGLLALIVSAIGIYSVVAFGVRQRTHEIGIRKALGAQSRDLVRLIVSQSTWTVAIGIALGIAGGFAMGKFIASLLFGISPRDPAAIGAAASLLLIVGVLASVIPAMRANKVDPAVALREE